MSSCAQLDFKLKKVVLQQGETCSLIPGEKSDGRHRVLAVLLDLVFKPAPEDTVLLHQQVQTRASQMKVLLENIRAAIADSLHVVVAQVHDELNAAVFRQGNA